MKTEFKGWGAVAVALRKRCAEEAMADEPWLNDGQRANLCAIAERMPNNGLIIADEVGMGKTRVAVTVARYVKECGGRVAVLVPPGLGYQWQTELKEGGLTVPPVLRSLWGFFEAWKSAEDSLKPWFEEPVLLISHVFTNWRLGEESAAWRWALLPELIAQWRIKTDGRSPRDYKNHLKLNDVWVKAAADSITAQIMDSRSSLEHDLMEAMSHEVVWGRHLFAGDIYARGEDHRIWLERAVGLSLGAVDLIIVDEAHKSRGEGSGLSRLLERVILHGRQARRMGLTATPIEIDVEQWTSSLERIGVAHAQKVKVDAILPYMKAIDMLRQSWRSSPGARRQFYEAARAFEQALSPYILRRGKGEDEAVARFLSLGEREGIHDYRHVSRVNVHPMKLDAHWRQALFAAEALSVTTRHSDDSVAQRLRLTLGNGHGIAAWLDTPLRNGKNDPGTESLDSASEHQALTPRDQKRLQRAAWWTECLNTSLRASSHGLYSHPAIFRAVQEIEKWVGKDEKVLVFGRFTKPMQALVNLLNARAMLRHLEEGRPWPQSKAHGDVDASDTDVNSEWPAIRAAHDQMNCGIALEQIDARLEDQYRKLENARERLRTNLIRLLAEGQECKNEKSSRTPARALFTRFKEINKRNYKHESLNLVARALADYVGTTSPEAAQPAEWWNSFEDMVRAVCDHDDFDEDGSVSDEQAQDLWSDISERLNDDYGSTQGRFARLMYGNTAMPTRRLIQAAFNRLQSLPQVLVAQSTVGREGLNLHRACRIVVLLHHEWNPGVVEQQIGRVDRVGSRWAKLCDEAEASDKAIEHWPRIEIRSVVFLGTYDAHNLRVLKVRWDNLRAQLHGDVLSENFQNTDKEGRAMYDEIVKAAPKFSPLCYGLR
ncbi:MAG: type III restriction endonuclease subunit R [Gammaproteobacteria bacterium]|nr:type III restriction endonuclease subunit R [Gammaproteobacteria bacterium]